MMKKMIVYLIFLAIASTPALGLEWVATWSNNGYYAMNESGEVWFLPATGGPASLYGNFGLGPWVSFASKDGDLCVLNPIGEIWAMPAGNSNPIPWLRTTLPNHTSWCRLQSGIHGLQAALTCNGELWSVAVVPEYLGSFNDGVSAAFDSMPFQCVLHASVPNPFNPSTTIKFSIPATYPVSLVVFDVSGKLVRTLIAGQVMEAGHREKVWNGRDDNGRAVSAGIYFYRLTAGDFTDVKRMALVK